MVTWWHVDMLVGEAVLYHHRFKPPTTVDVPINSHRVLALSTCLVTVLQVSLDESISEAPNMCYNICCQVNISFTAVHVHPQ